MAKNSDKNLVLERRRIELLHAIQHEANTEAIAKRVTALKHAVFGVAKKQHVRYHPFLEFADNSEWRMVHRCWESFATDEVISIVSGWAERPSYKDVMLACRDGSDKACPRTEDSG